MALTIGSLMKAQAQREARERLQERAKFLYEEYIKFDDLKEFSEYFDLSTAQAMDEITLGRRLIEKGL